MISEINEEKIESDISVKLVLSRGDFDKKMKSRRSGVTTKLLFFVRTFQNNTPKWFLYAVGAGLFTSAQSVGLTKEDDVGKSIYISIHEYDKSISGAARKAFKWSKG